MKRIRIIAICILTAFAETAESGQLIASDDKADDPFVQLVKATRFVANYKESAIVSAKVFGARAQGSDKEYAGFMAKVVSADLTDIQDCMSRVYAAGPLTSTDAESLVAIFKSPIGTRVLDLSQSMVIADIERGIHKPPDPSVLTEAERRELAMLYQTPVFARYNALVTSQLFSVAVGACLALSKVAKESGIKF